MESDDPKITTLLHKTIKKVTDDISKMHFNTAISALMIFLNAAEEAGSVTKETAVMFTKLIAPLAPHLAEELWEKLHSVTSSSPEPFDGTQGRLREGRIEKFVIESKWPTFDPTLLIEDTVTIVVQVNGKVRASIDVPADISEADAIAKAKEPENVQKYLEGKALKKEVYVKGRLVSLVV